MRTIASLVCVAVLAFASPVFAKGWDKVTDLVNESEDDGVDAFAAAINVPADHELSWTFKSTDDSTGVDVRGCENLDLLFWSNIEAATYDNAIRWWSCPTDFFSLNICEILEGSILSGDPAQGSGEHGIFGTATKFVFADIIWTQGTAIASIKCNPSA